MQDILEFLQLESVRALIAQGDLEAVYEMLPANQRNALSSYLISKDIDVFEYLLDVIPEQTFESISDLKEAKIRPTVKKICTAAFYGCAGLTEISFPDSIEELEDGCFAECKNLKTINFSDSITSIGVSAFDRCDSLSGELRLPANLKKLGRDCFCGSHITKLIIPNTLIDVEAAALGFMDDLKEIEYHGTIAEYRAYISKLVSPMRAKRLTQVICTDGKLTGEEMSGLKPFPIPSLRGAFYITNIFTDTYITLKSFDRKSQKFSCIESHPGVNNNELYFLTKASAETFLKNYPNSEYLTINQSNWDEAFYKIDTDYGPALATASYINRIYARVKHVKDHLPQSILTY